MSYLDKEESLDCEEDHEAKMLNEFFNQQPIEEPIIHWKPVAKDIKQNIKLISKNFER